MERPTNYQNNRIKITPQTDKPSVKPWQEDYNF